MALGVEEWSQGLSAFTGNDLKRGLDTWQEDWPPSLPEFRRACMGSLDSWEHRGQAYKKFPKALPKPKANPDIVKAELAKMRRKA